MLRFQQATDITQRKATLVEWRVHMHGADIKVEVVLLRQGWEGEGTSRKVELPMARLSEAPMRVCTASTTCSSADSAGTRLPTCTTIAVINHV